jgi:xanthine dehydrogenase YagT iron-sulfur-binding subunit
VAVARERAHASVQDSPLALTTSVNGAAVELRVAGHETLLGVLRDRLGPTGTKKGCDQGACGACRALIDGKRVLSCLTLAAQCEGRDITTIEGLAADGELHPVQEAFVRHDALQCGDCKPGQIMPAVALLLEGRGGSDDDIREFMSGNLCRCGVSEHVMSLATARSYACPNVTTTDRKRRLNIPFPGSMRGPGEAQGNFALESAIDEPA